MTSNFVSNRLLIYILIGIVVGSAIGGFYPTVGEELYFFGRLFVQALLVLVVPLIITSMVVGVSHLGDVRKLGSVAGTTILYYFVTTAIAVIIGISLVLIIEPGVSMTPQEVPFTENLPTRDLSLWGSVQNLLESLIPENLVTAMAENQVLPLIVFFVCFGTVLTTLGSTGERVIHLFEGLNAAILKIVQLVIWAAPVGIGALIAGRLGAAGGFLGFWPELVKLGLYTLTVILGLSLQAFVVLPLILYLFGKRDPFSYARGMLAAIASAFSTASSSATIPLSLYCATKRNQVSQKAANFVIPLGATINMDGTALYEAGAAIFIAQTYGIELTFVSLLIIFVTSTLAAIGAAGIPEAGLITMLIVLEAVHLPVEGIALILTIDWLLDRFRTAVNVWGDSVGAAVVSHHIEES